MIHELKTWPVCFEPMANGEKWFEVRPDDRGFLKGDRLLLREWDPASKEYTGRTLERQVTYILPGPAFGIQDGYCVMGLTAVRGA